MGNRCIDGALQIQHVFDELTPEQHQTRGSQIMLQFSQQLSLSFVDWHNGTGIAYGRQRLQTPKLHRKLFIYPCQQSYDRLPRSTATPFLGPLPRHGLKIIK